MRIIKKVIKIVVWLLITLTIIYNVYNIINVRVLKHDLTTVGGYGILEVVSGSMEPTIKVGDLIIIDTNSKKYKKNDIVTFYDTNGSFVTHRIISIDKNTMVTKGDFNDSKDDPTDMKKIVGKYVFRIPFVGLLLSTLKNPLFLIIILIIGILLSYLFSTDENGKLIVEEEKKTPGRKKLTEKEKKKRAKLREKEKIKKKKQKEKEKKKKERENKKKSG